MDESTEGITEYERCFDCSWELYDPNIVVPNEDLRVSAVDLDIVSNIVTHHTHKFDIALAGVYDDTELLVVRRGQEFNIWIKFNRPYDKAQDDLRFVFEFGKKAIDSKGSRVELVPSDKYLLNKWGAIIKSVDGNWLKVAIIAPPDCAIAKWILKVDVVRSKDSKVVVHRYKHSFPVYILFNPWCKDDQVYMSEDLDEYVLADTGEIYYGSYSDIRACGWKYGQFSGNVLDWVMYILDDVSKLQDHDRGNPVKITRKISSLVNSDVLVGEWPDTDKPTAKGFSDGVAPWKWTGSVNILHQYIKTKRPVKYGQCWVFSGIVTTVCRALGIPARSVTNFESAHDTDGSITIDEYFNRDGTKNGWLTSDSVWNYHVWNGVWMARPDLPKGYGGWQAIDATPQEESAGVLRMGPMPVKAIKEGALYLPYDGPFVFAEVNADRVTWCGKRVIKVDHNSIGLCISTKRPRSKKPVHSYASINCPNREDVTHEYKFADGSAEGREAVRRANLPSHKAYLSEAKEGDVAYHLDFKPTPIGETIKVCLKIKNNSNSERTIFGTTTLTSTDYRGRFHMEVSKNSISNLKPTVLKAQGETSVSFDVPFESYFEKLVDECFLKMTCFYVVKETEHVFSMFETMELEKPNIAIKAPEKGYVRKKFTTVATFKNPLPTPLTECELTLDGPGLQEAVVYPQKDVSAHGTFTCTFELSPEKVLDEDEIIVKFNSKQLYSIEGVHKMEISK